jgi:hypothetical protein
MTTVSILNLVAWLLSAVIAGWLVVDVVRVSRNYDEKELINAAEMFDDLDPQAADPATKKDGR